MHMSTSTAPEAVTGASWSAVISVAVGAFALVTTEFLPVGLLPQIAHDLHITEGQTGLMVTMPSMIAAIAALFTSTLTGRMDKRHVLMALLGLLALSNALVAVATNVVALLAGRVLLGVAVGSFWTIGVAIGPRLRPGADGVRATSIIFSGVSIGTVAGVPAGAFLGNLAGWRWSFGAAAIMALLVTAALALWLPSLKSDKVTGVRAIFSVLRIPALVVGLIATTVIFLAQFATYTYVTPFLNQITHIGGATISALLLAYGATGFVGNLLGGWAAAKDVRKALIVTSLLIGGSVLLLAQFGASPLPAITLVLIWGLGFGMLPIALQSWMFQSAPDQMDSTGALFVAIAQIAVGGGALVGGLVVDHFGLTATMVVGGVMAVFTAVLVVQAARRHAPGGASPAMASQE